MIVLYLSVYNSEQNSRTIVENISHCPKDIAKLTFYQFVATPLGADFTTMISLSGSLNPAQWEGYENWWNRERENLDNRLKKRGDCPDWPMYVAWRSKLFMHIFFGIQKIMVINLTTTTVEQLIWDLTALRNILFDLKLVAEEDLTLKPTTYFQKVAMMGKQVVLTIYSFYIVFRNQAA